MCNYCENLSWLLYHFPSSPHDVQKKKKIKSINLGELFYVIRKLSKMSNSLRNIR